jgi:hypothetical protein
MSGPSRQTALLRFLAWYRNVAMAELTDLDVDIGGRNLHVVQSGQGSPISLSWWRAKSGQCSPLSAKILRPG